MTDKKKVEKAAEGASWIVRIAKAIGRVLTGQGLGD